MLEAALGELSGQLLGDMYVVPERLTDDGYRFCYPDVARGRLGRPASLNWSGRCRAPRLTRMRLDFTYLGLGPS